MLAELYRRMVPSCLGLWTRAYPSHNANWATTQLRSEGEEKEKALFCLVATSSG